jgi:hypothetical protein
MTSRRMFILALAAAAAAPAFAADPPLVTVYLNPS